MAAFKGWRTFAFGLLVAIVPVILAALQQIDWNNSGLPAWAISLIGVIIMILRYVTTSPIGKAAAILVAAAGLSLGLSACQPGGTVQVPQPVISDAEACGLALLATGNFSLAGLAAAAATVPACQRLVPDVLTSVIQSTATKNAARMGRRVMP